MTKSLIIGLDLSFNSSGISAGYLEDSELKKISFHKLIFDDESNKKKIYTPTEIKNVNISTYKFPTNISVQDIILDVEDTNNYEQCSTTIKAMICSKRIGQIINELIELLGPDELIVSIENYIMPAYSGKNQMKTVSGLIMLQGFVREFAVRLSLNTNIKKFKIFTPTPSSNKLFFTGNGGSDKPEMVKFFLTKYDGNKLIPDIKITDVAKINDVVDAFSLMLFAISKLK